MGKVIGVEVLSYEVVGREGGFLAIQRLRLRNVRDDGTRSTAYLCDFLLRPKGVDAVVVAIWSRRPDGGVDVLARDGLRPALRLGRPNESLAIPDTKQYLFFREVVAGIIERRDHGEAGIRARAALEVDEETGLKVRAEDIQLLGNAPFPTPGTMAERFFLAAVEVPFGMEPAAASGDGSPMEEGARVAWLDLDEAIAACVRGEIEDMKSELAWRRLRDRLAGR